MTVSVPARLRRHSARGVAWQSLAGGSGMAVQAVLALVAARMVGPEAFAVWGVAAVVFNGQHLLAILGLGPALVRHARRDTDEQALLNAAVVTTAAIAVPGAAALALAAPAITGWFGLSGPEAEDFVRVTALVVAVLVVGQVLTASLERAMHFGRRAAVDLTATGAYALATVVLLMAGAGIWALLWGRLAHAVVTAGVAVALAPVRPRLGRVDLRLVRTLAGFGGPVGLSAIAGVAFTNLDTLIVGNLNGPEDLGRYALAYSVASFVPTLAAITVGRVYFASISAAGPAERRALLRDLARVCGLAAAATAALVALSGPALQALFGGEWRGLTAVLLPLAAYAAFRIGALAVNTATGALGAPMQLLVNEVVGLAVALALVPVLGGRGAEGVAAAFAIGQLACLATGTAALRFRILGRPAG